MNPNKDILIAIEKSLNPSSKQVLRQYAGNLINKEKSDLAQELRFQKSYNRNVSDSEQGRYNKYERQLRESSEYQSAGGGGKGVIILILVLAVVIAIVLGLSWLIRFFFNFNFWPSIAFVVGSILGIVIFILAALFAINRLYSHLASQFESIKHNSFESETKRDTQKEDEVYRIIKDTYETLSYVRIERERQAKNSYNAAVGLIVTGILIIFFGIYLLFANEITSGSLTSGIGGISNIIGGTILKFYKDTNNRMDSINNDLFVLNTAKVQYALILKIQNNSKRDEELRKLVLAIGKIKK